MKRIAECKNRNPVTSFYSYFPFLIIQIAICRPQREYTLTSSLSAQRSCGGDTGSVPYVRMYVYIGSVPYVRMCVRTYVRRYVHLCSSL